jgi:hypothetical protein
MAGGFPRIQAQVGRLSVPALLLLRIGLALLHLRMESTWSQRQTVIPSTLPSIRVELGRSGTVAEIGLPSLLRRLV